MLAISAILSFAMAVTIFAWMTDANLLRIWEWNYHNHAAFYDQYERTYWKWLLVNPLEFGIGIGLPVVVLVVATSWKRFQDRTNARDERLGPLMACSLVWLLLWVSGKNMGEAARLWIVLTPGLIWLLGSMDAGSSTDQPTDRAIKKWVFILALQAVVCAATVARVDGFHFSSLTNNSQSSSSSSNHQEADSN